MLLKTAHIRNFKIPYRQLGISIRLVADEVLGALLNDLGSVRWANGHFGAAKAQLKTLISSLGATAQSLITVFPIDQGGTDRLLVKSDQNTAARSPNYCEKLLKIHVGLFYVQTLPETNSEKKV